MAELIENDLPVEHEDHWCWYCESNWYDTSTCEDCAGKGCEECNFHGWWGYSW